MARVQFSIALHAVSLVMASQKVKTVEVSPQTAQVFIKFWQAHADCPMVGRNKVGQRCPLSISCVVRAATMGQQFTLQEMVLTCMFSLCGVAERETFVRACRFWPVCALSSMACSQSSWQHCCC